MWLISWTLQLELLLRKNNVGTDCRKHGGVQRVAKLYRVTDNWRMTWVVLTGIALQHTNAGRRRHSSVEAEHKPDIFLTKVSIVGCRAEKYPRHL